MRRVKLSTSNDYVIVDDTDYIRVLMISWRLNNIKTGVIGRGPKGMTTLGRFILGAVDEVDHIDRDILNNQRSNLREVTTSQNGHNKIAPITNTSGYKGVHWNKQKNKWQARLTISRDGVKHTHHIGFYSTPEAAAHNYNIFAKLALKDHVLLNEVTS